MVKLFGTDGIRGIANTELTCDLSMDIARAAGVVVADAIDKRPTFLIGMDTRISGRMLEASIIAGLCSIGANVISIGVVPTPAVSYLVSKNYADAGIMISASHNPFDFNGIKIFGPGGNKLTDEQEFLIEDILKMETKPYPNCWRDDIGTVVTDSALIGHYIDHLIETVSDIDLSGMRVALDCSNGSASATAKQIFEKTGAEVSIINCRPNGVNINDNCGSTHIEIISDFVKNGNFDVGFAFDGDADRCLFVDEFGNSYTGDTALAILSLDLKQQGKLNGNTLVATIMSNMGLFEFARLNDISVDITKVGDRYVLESIISNDFNLGGEESGHVIMKNYMNTGDGQLTALHIMAVIKRSGTNISQLCKVITRYPQVMKNIKADQNMKSKLAVDEGAQKIIEKAEKQLGDNGRILVRPSGTEPLIRVMIEGKDIDEIKQLLNQVSGDLSDRLKYY